MLRFIYEEIVQRLNYHREVQRDTSNPSLSDWKSIWEPAATGGKDQLEKSKLWRLNVGNWGTRKLQGEWYNQVAGLGLSLCCFPQDVLLGVNHERPCSVKHYKLIIYPRALCEPQK